MRSFFIFFIMALIFMPYVAQADEQLLNLFPQGREKHQSHIDNNQGKYLARGQAYVDHMYATGSEEPMAEPDDAVLESEADTIPVDVRDVAKIIKQSAPH